MTNPRRKRTSATSTTRHLRFRLVVTHAVLLVIIASSGALYAETPEQRAWGILRDGMNDSNTVKRSQAVLALRFLPFDPEAARLAKAALKDRKPEVRAAAANALGSIGSSDAIPELKKALDDTKPTVAMAAAHSLQVLNDPAGSEVYYELLIGERKASDGVVAQQTATFTDWKKVAELGLSQGLAFFPGGSAAFSAVMALREDNASPVRATAATALADDMDPRFGRALVRATSDKNWTVRASALSAIAERGDPELLSAIVPALSDKNQAVRFTAAAAVIRLTTVAARKRDARDTSNVLEGDWTSRQSKPSHADD
jgi:HEAT repeat protein